MSGESAEMAKRAEIKKLLDRAAYLTQEAMPVAKDRLALLSACEVLYRRVPSRFGRAVVISSLRRWADQIGEQL